MTRAPIEVTDAAPVERLSLRGASIYVAQSCQRLRGQHPRGQRQSLGIRSHGANPHPGSQPGGCRCHGSSHHSRQAKSNRSSNIYSLYPSKLRPGGSLGQEEALRPPRRRQLFVSASDHSFRIFAAFEQMPVARPRDARGKPRKGLQIHRKYHERHSVARRHRAQPRAGQRHIERQLGPRQRQGEADVVGLCGMKRRAADVAGTRAIDPLRRANF